MEYVIQHHGILGQKWGVRRFQNLDGSLTNAGRLRYQESIVSTQKTELPDYVKSDGYSKIKTPENARYYNKNATKEFVSEQGRRLIDMVASDPKKFAAIAGTIGLGAYVLGSKKAKANLRKTVKKAKEFATSEKTKAFVSEQGRRLMSSIDETASRAGKAAIDAATLATSMVAIDRITKRLAADDDDTESMKDLKRIMLMTSTATINSASKGGNYKSNGNYKSSGNGYNSKGNDTGKVVSGDIGAPSHKPIDKSSEAYRNLFTNVSPEEKATIKSMASAGYDLDQLQKYKSGLRHSDLRKGDYVIIHSGVKGQKWGERRYQNPDGTYTEEGKARRRKEESPEDRANRSAKMKKIAKIAGITALSVAALTSTAYAGSRLYKRGKNKIKYINPYITQDAKEYKALLAKGKKSLDNLTYQELLKVNNTQSQRNKFKQNNTEKKLTALAGVTAAATTIGAVNNLYNQYRTAKQNVDREVGNLKKRKQKKNQ